ncbi:hypothetical protein GWK88_14935 [Enterobacter roggenkampii]|uniref:hypothetical protein n=1 Tax=Enterobacter roggenkampii TaxID=1812935 RepID=UPI0013F3ED42|nr:hypothetical protein [Enterobacter roggenkampii]NHA25147.1 hypothetical protein [Enterobacter roggenkampii]
MKEFKGTPGEWNYSHARGEVVSKSEGLIAELVVNGQEDNNGSLIAAAPDLLEALQELVFLYEHDEGCRDLTEYKRAKAAISKALVEY